ncbi:MAG: thiamine pyrophosphate-binding protein [Rhizobiales bacterium]|nr:thiamine pyrophosphate-binding protein [Hyphomicrobiales bacterium]
MLTCEFIARFLKARGVSRVFGTPGSDTINLIHALKNQGIDYTLTHHENTAAYMAATHGELTGVPGVVVVTKGPGVTNLASGIAAAHLDRRPIIVFSAILDGELLARNPHQDVPLVAFGELISKLSEEVTAENALDLLPRAYQTAISPRPGAVYLPISPVQSTTELAADGAVAQAVIDADVAPEVGAVPDISAAAELVAMAKKPVAVVGVGVVGTGTSRQTVAALEALGIPACVTLQAVGQVPNDHPLYIGMYGWFGTPVDRMLEAADLILTIGLDGWDIIRPFRAKVPIVSLDPVDANDRTFQPVTAGLTGDLGAMLDALAVSGLGPREWGEAEAQACYREIREHELGVSAEHDEANGIAPQAVYKELRKLVPHDTIITADAGAHKSLASQAWEAYGPRSYFVSNGLSPMGFALGAAMGAKLAEPQRTVITVVGDGGFLMYAGDLATLARLDLPIIQIVMVDNAMTQVKSRQLKQGYSTQATDFQVIDYCEVARSLGVEAARADTVESFRTAIAGALKSARPTTIEVILDASEYRRMPSAV